MTSPRNEPRGAARARDLLSASPERTRSARRVALLDSHALIWALEGSDKLSPAAAQALEDGIPLVTRDPNIARYQVQVIW